jgi:predicted transcriptional regulator
MDSFTQRRSPAHYKSSAATGEVRYTYNERKGPSMTIELERVLTPELFERLQAKAERENTPLEAALREAVAEYLNEDNSTEFEDTPDDEILERFRRGWEQIQRGETIDAEEGIARIKAKHARHR